LRVAFRPKFSFFFAPKIEVVENQQNIGRNAAENRQNVDYFFTR